MIYLITYDLSAPTKDYDGLYKGIKSCGKSWIRPADSVWLIDSDLPTEKVVETLLLHLDGNDKLFVVQCESEWVALNLGKEDEAWLEKRSGE